MAEIQPDAKTTEEAQPDQSDLIRTLEQRLNDLEKKLTLVAAIQENNGSEGTGDNDEEGPESNAINQNGRPPIPPTIPELHKVDLLQYYFHLLPAKSFPAVEAVIAPASILDKTKEVESFKSSYSTMSPVEVTERIKPGIRRPSEHSNRMACFRINSSPLSRLLFALFCHQTTDHLMFFNRPFRVPIYYHGEAQRKLKDMETLYGQNESDAPSSEMALMQDLRCYVHFMEHEIIPFYSRFDTLSATDDFKVYFNDLWHLFKPGETIYYQQATSRPSAADYKKLYRSKRTDQKLWRVYTRTGDDSTFWVKAYCIDYDGANFVCVKEWFAIEKFYDYVSVNSLKVFPIRFATNQTSILHESASHGREFQKFIDSKLVAHSGWASEPDHEDPTMRYVTSDVVIDFEETFRAHPDWKTVCKLPSASFLGTHGKFYREAGETNWCWHDEKKVYMEEEPTFTWEEKQIPRIEKRGYCFEKDQFLANWINDSCGPSCIREEDLHLLPRRLFAYSLQDRMFLAVDVSSLKPIKDRREKFEDLIIDPRHESMLRALVHSHFKQKEIHDSSNAYITGQDIVQNKGRGLVILLHGVPGVGKTSTAETIASDFKKPLLPITCGDLGLDPATVEKSLKQMFRVAQLWDCILLLDEADVFLAERVSSDLSRNALVSVFLRVLDYYSGVLFLTTNRVGTIDEAFKSRIHISLYYPHLKLRQTERIWQVNLNRLEAIEKEQSNAAQQEPLNIDRQRIMEYAKEHYQSNKNGKGRWNGRQIRNAFLIASALARFEKSYSEQRHQDLSDLNDRHFKTVVEAGMGFERYLLEAKGQTDAEAAYMQGTRADHVVSAAGKPKSNNGDDASHRSPPAKPSTPVMTPISSALGSPYPPSRQYPSQQYGTYNEGFLSPGKNMYIQPPPPQLQYAMNMVNAPDGYGQPMNMGYAPPQSTTPSMKLAPVYQAPPNGQWPGDHNGCNDSDE